MIHSQLDCIVVIVRMIEICQVSAYNLTFQVLLVPF